MKTRPPKMRIAQFPKSNHWGVTIPDVLAHFLCHWGIFLVDDADMRLSQLAQLRGMHPDIIRRMIDNVCFIADHFRAQQKTTNKISENWSYVAMVLDRLLLIVFSTVNIVGTILILTQSPSLTDTREALKVTSPMSPLSGDTYAYSSYWKLSKP